MLFMDDTTLVAKTLPQLQQVAERYVHFCRMFRIRINPTKSTIMAFSRAPAAVPVARAEIVAGGMVFSMPKSGTQRYLGGYSRGG